MYVNQVIFVCSFIQVLKSFIGFHRTFIFFFVLIFYFNTWHTFTQVNNKETEEVFYFILYIYIYLGLKIIFIDFYSKCIKNKRV